MSNLHKNVSQVKLNIKQIFDNLQNLTDSKEGDESVLTQLQINTEDLLNQLEILPLEKLKTKLKKRQRQRRNKKLKKLKILKNKQIKETKNPIYKEPVTTISKHDKAKPQQLQGVKECQRILQTFELLQQLHLARGQNSSDSYKFSLKLRQLKSIWNCLLQEKLQEVTSAEVNIEQQWQEVLFGPPEKTFFEDKPDLQDFVRKRHIWDSYIDNKYGTSIPIGWIIPKKESSEQWKEYLSSNV